MPSSTFFVATRQFYIVCDTCFREGSGEIFVRSGIAHFVWRMGPKMSGSACMGFAHLPHNVPRFFCFVNEEDTFSSGSSELFVDCAPRGYPRSKESECRLYTGMAIAPLGKHDVVPFVDLFENTFRNAMWPLVRREEIGVDVAQRL